MRFILTCGLLTLTVLSVDFSTGSGRVDAQTEWQTFEIKADEYSFTPNRIQAKADRPLELVVINEGHEPHQFRSSLFKNQMIEVQIGENVVRGRGIEVVDIAAGATARIRLLSPPPGQFDFQCRIPSHHGMDGMLLIETDK
ncbi:MAG: cupredoxin domain-containing protein [Nitrospirae bacterium]|nr:cupredoxin domain-containing protein [Nitrospirota bacterium]